MEEKVIKVILGDLAVQPMFPSIMRQKLTKGGAKRGDDGGGDFGRHRSSVNTSSKHETGAHVWVIIISFWVHIQTKRQSQLDSSSNSYPLSNRLSGDQSFVDVPLEPIAITVDNGLKPQFNRI
ncbi:unnamed protein product [Oppiella nova]|uniref:Uncharacterized protein n=1 Tax=Oppiella nova TaxID=334625 RepID=A0A7R9QSE9_9ACAR|nr:unnamed protein product [Oppiella nova]CAG2172678.1 unnamed protein product [Oppiella nova]